MGEILHTPDKDAGNILCIAQSIEKSLVDGLDPFERFARGDGKYKGISVHADRCVTGQTRILVLSRVGPERQELECKFMIIAGRALCTTNTYHSSGINNICRKMDLSKTNRLMMNVFDGRIISVCVCARKWERGRGRQGEECLLKAATG